MFGSVIRPTSILMIKSIQRTVISGELNHRKMVCSDSCKAQGPRLGVQQTYWFEDGKGEPLQPIKRIITKSLVGFMHLSVVGEGQLSISNGANPRTPQHLKAAITRSIRAIPADMCKRVIGNFVIRLNKYLNAMVHILSTSYDCLSSCKCHEVKNGHREIISLR